MHAAKDEPQDLADAALIAAIAHGRGREAAEAELCRRYQRRIYLYGLRHLRDAAAAADLVQDVLATVLEKARAGGVREPEKIGSFVLGTSRMLAANRARGEARRTRILAQYGDPREARRGYDHEEADSSDLERVAGCLDGLGDRERTVLLLSFYAELDSAAIARELGVAAGNVRVIRHRALARLQACVHAGRKEDV